MTEDLRRAALPAAGLAVDHLGGIRAGPVWQPMAETAVAWLRDQPLPDLAILLDEIRAVGTDVTHR